MASTPTVIEKWWSLQSNLVFLTNLSHCCDLSGLHNYLNFKIAWTAAGFSIAVIISRRNTNTSTDYMIWLSLVQRMFVFPITQRFVTGNITEWRVNLHSLSSFHGLLHFLFLFYFPPVFCVTCAGLVNWFLVYLAEVFSLHNSSGYFPLIQLVF